MGKFRSGFLFLLIAFSVSQAHAIYTEIGASYGYDKKNFDANNLTEEESLTGELSFYFGERIALELSYTDGTTLLKEKASATDLARTTEQKTQVLGADIVLMLADKTALLQPFIKGGPAQITRHQEVKVEGFDTQTLAPETAIVPTYGAGIKIMMTEQLSIKVSYNVWRTPIGGGTFTDDSSFRAGISWMF